jgi:hypothetical protein
MFYKYKMRKSIKKQQKNAAENGHERKSSADPSHEVMEHTLNEVSESALALSQPRRAIENINTKMTTGASDYS